MAERKKMKKLSPVVLKDSTTNRDASIYKSFCGHSKPFIMSIKGDTVNNGYQHLKARPRITNAALICAQKF